MPLALPSPQASPGKGTFSQLERNLISHHSFSPTTTAPSSVSGLLNASHPYSSLLLSPRFSYEENHSSEKWVTRGGGEHLKGYKVFGHNTDQNAFFPWCFQPKDYIWLNQKSWELVQLYEMRSVQLISSDCSRLTLVGPEAKFRAIMFIFLDEIINY